MREIGGMLGKYWVVIYGLDSTNNSNIIRNNCKDDSNINNNENKININNNNNNNNNKNNNNNQVNMVNMW